MTSPATFYTPAGWAERCTFRDDTLPHQIRLLAPTGRRAHLLVSCNCRHGEEPIAQITDTEQAWAAYHDYHREQI